MDIHYIHNLCNVCGSRRSTLFFETEERVYKTHLVFTYVRCEDCGLVYLNPRPDPDSMKRYFFEDIERFSTMGTGKLVQELYRLYYHFERPQFVSRPGRMLDMGAGIGRLMEVYRKRGWQVEGIDVSVDSCAYAQRVWGLSMRQADVTQTGWEDSSFDLVTMWQFIEHCDDPMGSLREAYRVLKPGGILELGEVVNVESFEFNIFRQDCIYIATPIHFFLYSKPVITRMLADAGFRVLKIRHDFLNPLLLSGSTIDYCDKILNLKASHKLRQNLSYLLFLALVPITLLLKMLGKSTTITVYAQKGP